MTYASFRKRAAACIVDIIIFEIVCFLFTCVLYFLEKFIPNFYFAEPTIFAIFSITYYLYYFVYMESSLAQATLGKKLFGLKVTNLEGKRISFVQSLGRNLGIFVSLFTLGIGCLMCLWPPKKQCLHDKMAKCLIEDKLPQHKQTVALCVIWAVCISMIVGLSSIHYVVLPKIKQNVIQFYQEIYQEQMTTDSPNNTSMHAANT